jgi:radical SAM protein with 4Fe4S-binding SPASM domain
MITLFRQLKNLVVSNKKVLYAFLIIINTSFIGDIYDFFYLMHIRRKIKKSDYMVTIEPNNICNLRCIMCPYKEMKRKKVVMSLILFKKVVDEAKEIGCKEIHLTQYNEPFTDRFLSERLVYIRKKGMKSSFYSNATLMNQEMIKKVLENPPDLIRFSVDGTKKETFESVRNGANYETVVENINNLFQERNRIGLKLPVIEVFFTVLDKNRKEALKFLSKWKNNSDFASLYPADSRSSKDFVGINYKKLKSYPCFNPKKIIILSNGKVVLCCVDIDGSVILGDIKKQTLKEILNSNAYREIYKSQLNRTCNIKMCQDCSKYYIDSAFFWWIF